MSANTDITSTNTDIISTFNKLNVKQRLSILDMTPFEDYAIRRAERINTKYGEVIVLELHSSILYLPKRFNSLSDEDIEKLSTGSYLINKIPFNKDLDSYQCRLELKPIPPAKDYYPFNTFK